MHTMLAWLFQDIHENFYERMNVRSAYYMIKKFGVLMHFCMSRALGYFSVVMSTDAYITILCMS